MAKNNRRPQASKRQRGMGNEAMMRGMQGLRMSNAAGPHRSETDYSRKSKHRNRMFEDR